MRIKIFECDNVALTSLDKLEAEVNYFISTHKVLDIKVSTLSYNYTASVIYTVLYEEG